MFVVVQYRNAFILLPIDTQPKHKLVITNQTLKKRMKSLKQDLIQLVKRSEHRSKHNIHCIMSVQTSNSKKNTIGLWALLSA